MIYMKAEIELGSVHINQMVELLTTKIFPFLEGKAGWKMMGCFVQRAGRLHTIIDLWELEDYNHYPRALAMMAAEHPDYAEIRKGLDTYVQKETVVFLERKFGLIGS